MNPGARMGKMHGYTSKNGMGSYLLTESRFLTFSAEVETEIAKKISVRSFHLSREKDVCLEGRHRENVTPDYRMSISS